MVAGDRVSQLYNREIDRPAIQDACRDRIHWICAQAAGRTVLDVGCSQGIACLLLGRAGFEVTGVDVDAAAIGYAREQLEAEPESVRSNVTFQHVDGGPLAFDDASFDTVVLTEIIEHLTHPQRLLAECRRKLKSDGRIIITTPFGLHPHPEHVQTFFMTNFLALVSGFFAPRELLVRNKYIYFVGDADSSTADRGITGVDRLLKLSEAAFLAAEERYVEEKDESWNTSIEQLRRLKPMLQGALADLRSGKMSGATEQSFLKQLTRIAEGSETLSASRVAHDVLPELIRTLRHAHAYRIEALTRDHQAAIESAKRQTATAESELNEVKRRFTRQSDELAEVKTTLNVRVNEVRYRLGDLLVGVAYNPARIFLLPWRLGQLFLEGLGKRRARGSDATQSATFPAATTQPTAPSASAPEPTFKAVKAPTRPPRNAITAAVILDEFSYECFRGECEMILITPENWKETLERRRPDFLFVESAWKGNEGAWSSQITRAAYMDVSPLAELVTWCQEQKIPTVFWNKEDPPNFDHFIFAAAKFDTIFTTDENCIPRYKEKVGHDRVYALPFAAQTDIHNPIDSNGDRLANFCFAGTYYAKRHEDRRGDIDLILRPALTRGLHIFDRMHGYTKSDYYKFPPEYVKCIQGSLSYPEMVDAYKKYRVFLNVNSVRESPTMFSRRVFELLACGTPVISTYSLGIEQMLGRECVAVVDAEDQAVHWMDKLIDDPDLRDRMVLLGQRKIFAEHTYEHRFRTIARTIGLTVDEVGRSVSVVTCTNRPAHLENVIENYERQVWPDKELVLVLNSDAFDLEQVKRRLESVPNARAFQLPEAASLGQCLNHGFDQARHDYITKFDDDNFHAEYFLTDLMQAFTYSGADVVGKCSYYAHLEGSRCLVLRFPNMEHRFVKFLSGSAMIIRRHVLASVRFPEKDVGEDTSFLAQCVDQGFKLYSADRFNYAVKRGKSAEDHTWKIEDEEYLRKCAIVAEGVDTYREAVTV